MSATNPTPEPQRRARTGRVAVGVALALVVIVTPLVLVALNRDSESSPTGPVVKTGALATVRAAVGQTAAAGSYEMATETSTSQPGASFCPPSQPTCAASPPRTNQFSSRSIVNLEPYAMVSYTKTSSFGDVTLHVNSMRVWQQGGATVGYAPGNPGVALSDYSRQVLGTLGPGPGALAMISIASRGGYLNLEEETVATARPAGTGTVDDVPVTYYDVTIDITKLADAPNLNDVQRATIAAALPILKSSGYTGTSERIGVDDAGFVREVTATTKFNDGATTERHSVLSKFGCAPTVTMPNEVPSNAPLPPCATGKPTTTTTTGTPANVSSTTSAPSTTTSSTSSTTTTSTAPGAPKPSIPTGPVQVLNGNGVQGAATIRSNELTSLGWVVLPAGNAPALRAGTAIQCVNVKGLDQTAAQLAGALARFGVTTTIEAIPDPLPAEYDPKAACYVILGT